MKVVLRKDVKGVGKVGDVMDVSDGYGRNFLLPRGFAVLASEGALAQAAGLKAAHERRDAKLLSAAKELAAKLESQPVVVKAKAGEQGRLFGAVTNVQIAEEMQRTFGVDIDRHKIALDEPIKTAGDHTCLVKLDMGVSARVTVRVTQ